ncbi:THAP domain-containing protein 6 [Frankliniella fusca]|uniref:THAP domain-containing protein 6 n=1 Tax=Frankliniella fusca TaxID=407009 RepID=A0AAE1L9X6_9NEOP|nr:THAP domain-containing protein 6 [Frankliniella fusca]KAK3911209.1 THAP domain-containing protein 6 [Frankliniella fusca]KAK3917856.1 THAP domain-containing protein 6 [Frankliniella fusca]KAK3918273.1 THAP domain-containing protein 6 [Frankliniella fusca]
MGVKILQLDITSDAKVGRKFEKFKLCPTRKTEGKRSKRRTFPVLANSMPSSCSDIRCTNKYENGYCLVSFPKDDARKLSWASAMGRIGWQPKSSDRLCRVHLKLSDWVALRKLLKPDAVPTIFCVGCCRVPFRSAHLSSQKMCVALEVGHLN